MLLGIYTWLTHFAESTWLNFITWFIRSTFELSSASFRIHSTLTESRWYNSYVNNVNVLVSNDPFNRLCYFLLAVLNVRPPNHGSPLVVQQNTPDSQDRAATILQLLSSASGIYCPHFQAQCRNHQDTPGKQTEVDHDIQTFLISFPYCRVFDIGCWMLFDHHGRTWNVSLSCHLLSFFVPFHSFARAKQNLALWVGYESGAWGVEDVQQEGDAKGEWRLDLRWWPRVSLSWVPLLVSDEHPGSHGCSAEGDGVGVGWIVATKHGHAAENTPANEVEHATSLRPEVVFYFFLLCSARRGTTTQLTRRHLLQILVPDQDQLEVNFYDEVGGWKWLVIPHSSWILDSHLEMGMPNNIIDKSWALRSSSLIGYFVREGLLVRCYKLMPVDTCLVLLLGTPLQPYRKPL